jgi:hypothetical protein
MKKDRDRDFRGGLNGQSKDYFFVILSAAKNLAFYAAEILYSAALRSE